MFFYGALTLRGNCRWRQCFPTRVKEAQLKVRDQEFSLYTLLCLAQTVEYSEPTERKKRQKLDGGERGRKERRNVETF